MSDISDIAHQQLFNYIKRYKEYAEKYEPDVEFTIKFMLDETNSVQQIQKIFRKFAGWLNNDHKN